LVETGAGRVYEWGNGRGREPLSAGLPSDYATMQTIIEDNTLLSKTRELCEAILVQPEYLEIRKSIDLFLADDEAKSQYELVSEKGEALHHKQHSGVELTAAEIADFEHHRDALTNNSVARGFIEARGQMQKIQESVTQYVAKTFELGRLPTESEMDSGGGSCGSGCGCH
jgi:cell fate (sporulation/competence/biofilm development) regulator YlbF (YheA/YmcA/DUF963 family)